MNTSSVVDAVRSMRQDLDTIGSSYRSLSRFRESSLSRAPATRSAHVALLCDRQLHRLRLWQHHEAAVLGPCPEFMTIV